MYLASFQGFNPGTPLKGFLRPRSRRWVVHMSEICSPPFDSLAMSLTFINIGPILETFPIFSDELLSLLCTTCDFYGASGISTY